MTSYSYAFNGICEADINGDYETLEKCEAQCRSVENRDIFLMILGYDPEVGNFLIIIKKYITVVYTAPSSIEQRPSPL
jgi:hypothetical protein